MITPPWSKRLSAGIHVLKKGEAVMPDILLIDGGKGQLTQAEKVLEELTGDQDVLLLVLPKGSVVKQGKRRLILGGTRKEAGVAR